MLVNSNFKDFIVRRQLLSQKLHCSLRFNLSRRDFPIRLLVGAPRCPSKNYALFVHSLQLLGEFFEGVARLPTFQLTPFVLVKLPLNLWIPGIIFHLNNEATVFVQSYNFNNCPAVHMSNLSGSKSHGLSAA